MADTARDQLRRLLHVIPRFADDEDHTYDEIASAVGCDPRQVRADLVALTQHDAAGMVESVSVLLEPGHASMVTNEFFRPMRLTMSELCALELGLNMLRLERAPNEHAVIDRALKRLLEAITQLPSNDRHVNLRAASLQATGGSEWLSLIRAARRTLRMVRIAYRAGGKTETVQRDIAPYALVHVDAMWYVVTLGDDNEPRRFRLDRIAHAEMLDTSFTHDPTVVDRAVDTGRAFSSSSPRHMTVRYSPRIARWVAEREGTSVAADGSLTLQHQVADDSWAVRHVLQYGPEAEVIEPAELRTLIRERLESMLAV